MKAAYICADPGVPVFGSKGCSIHVQELICAFRQAGIQVSLVTNNVDGRRPHALSRISIYQLPRDISKAGEKRAAVNEILPSVLQSLGKLDFVYERYSLWSFAAIEWASSRGIPSLLEVNSPLIDEQRTYRNLTNQKDAEQVASRAFQAASFILIVSEELKKYMQRFSVNPDKVHVVPNAVNPFRFPRGITPALNSRVFTVGFLGSLRPWHGLSCLIDAFEILYRKDPNIRLLFIGDGPERNSLVEKLTHKSLLHASYFTGMIPASEVPRFLASIDVAVAPYPQIEDLYFSPIKVFEYMAAGLPIVASALGQLNKIIEPEVTGLLCEPGNAVVLAREIERLRNAPELRMRLGIAARMKVLANYTWSKNADRILNLIQQNKPGIVAAQGA